MWIALGVGTKELAALGETDGVESILQLSDVCYLVSCELNLIVDVAKLRTSQSGDGQRDTAPAAGTYPACPLVTSGIHVQIYAMNEDVVMNFFNELHKFEHSRRCVTIAYRGSVNGMPLGN